MAPVKYPSLYAGDEDGKVTASAAMWGVQGDVRRADHHDPLLRRAAQLLGGPGVRHHRQGKPSTRDHYFARDPLKPEVTLVDYTVTSNEDTVESQVNAARDERDRLALWSRVLPITFTALGMIALVGGGLLGSFSLRTETALIDPGLDRATRSSSAAAGSRRRCPARKPRPRSCPRSDPIAREDPRPGSDAPDAGLRAEP